MITSQNKHVLRYATVASVGAPITYLLIVLVDSILHEKNIGVSLLGIIFVTSLLFSMVLTLAVTFLVLLLKSIIRVSFSINSLLAIVVSIIVVIVAMLDRPISAAIFLAFSLINIILFSWLSNKNGPISD